MLTTLANALPLILHYGIAGVLVAGAIAVYFLVPNEAAKKWAVVVGVAGGIWIVGYMRGDHDRKTFDTEQAEAVRKAALDEATRARKDADLSIPPLTEAERADDRARPAIGKPCIMRDPWDRDCRKGSLP